MKNWWKRGTRWHDTSTATWTSVDPITRLNDPTRANAYLYVGGDPINRFDPAGRDDTALNVALIGMGVIGVVTAGQGLLALSAASTVLDGVGAAVGFQVSVFGTAASIGSLFD